MLLQAEQLDLHPTRWTSALAGESSKGSTIRALGRFGTPLQITVQQLACLVLPLAIYFGLDRIGVDITGVVYFALVVSLALTAAAIWTEGFAALRRPDLPEEPDSCQPATAVIAAYLPNEAATVVETVEAFLLQDYPDLQVILAYNTPHPLPSRTSCRRSPRGIPGWSRSASRARSRRRRTSTPRSRKARGEFIGVFDADHHPDPGSFRRACQMARQRHGRRARALRRPQRRDELRHPARRRRVRGDLRGQPSRPCAAAPVRDLRRHERLLARRACSRGSACAASCSPRTSTRRCASSSRAARSSPTPVSSRLELAPESMKALWNQRMRWAQGWTQVSWRHLVPMLKRPGASLRSRIGAFYLLAWREVYPWVSLQIFPLLAFWLLRGNPPINWFVPIFVLDDPVHAQRGPGAGALRVEARAPVDQGAQALVRLLPLLPRFSSTPR